MASWYDHRFLYDWDSYVKWVQNEAPVIKLKPYGIPIVPMTLDKATMEGGADLTTWSSALNATKMQKYCSHGTWRERCDTPDMECANCGLTLTRSDYERMFLPPSTQSADPEPPPKPVVPPKNDPATTDAELRREFNNEFDRQVSMLDFTQPNPEFYAAQAAHVAIMRKHFDCGQEQKDYFKELQEKYAQIGKAKIETTQFPPHDFMRTISAEIGIDSALDNLRKEMERVQQAMEKDAAHDMAQAKKQKQKELAHLEGQDILRLLWEDPK